MSYTIEWADYNKKNKAKFNVRPSDCNFIIDKQKKTVVCIYQHCSHDFINFINDNCVINFYSLDFEDARQKLYDKMLMPNRFVGVAKCSDDDDWNEEVGRVIAFSRMKDNLNRSFFKRANTFFNTVDKWLDSTAELVNKIGEKLEINQSHRHDYITSLIREKEKEDA